MLLGLYYSNPDNECWQERGEAASTLFAQRVCRYNSICAQLVLIICLALQYIWWGSFATGVTIWYTVDHPIQEFLNSFTTLSMQVKLLLEEAEGLTLVHQLIARVTKSSERIIDVARSVYTKLPTLEQAAEITATLQLQANDFVTNAVLPLYASAWSILVDIWNRFSVHVPLVPLRK
jgi:hypothetical protein